jgi:hypothetical protein
VYGRLIYTVTCVSDGLSSQEIPHPHLIPPPRPPPDLRSLTHFVIYGSLPLGEGGSAANEIDLKQGSGVVVGELWLLKCGRGRQNRLSFTGSDSRVDGS